MQVSPQSISSTMKTSLLSKEGVRKRSLKKSVKGLRKLYLQNTIEFCKNTTLHGLRYLISDDLYWIERIFFFFAFVGVFLVSIYFVFNVFAKWSRTPVIFSINPQPTFITNEPFPAVTICNLNLAYKSIVERYSVNSVEYATIQMLCKNEVNVTIADSITDWSNINSFLANISQPCENMILYCVYGSQRYNCTEIFNTIITDEGLCCTFNMLHPSLMFSVSQNLAINSTYASNQTPVSWDAEKGYQKNVTRNFFPRTAVGTGETLGFSVILDVESENYYCSSASSIGFKVAFHPPNEMANVRENGLLLAPGRETVVRLTAEKIETEHLLRSLSRKARHCMFQDESQLTSFKLYSQRNCEMECASQLQMEYCGCISHYLPRIHGNESTCSIYEATCVERVRLASMISGFDTLECTESCYPSCFDLEYVANFYSTPLSHDGFQVRNDVVKNMSTKYVETNIAMMHAFFYENAFRSSKQSEFIGITDFLSNIGGILGLFFGFSFISIAELLFFGIVRPCRNERHAAFNSAHSRQIVLVKSGLKRRHPGFLRPLRKRYGFPQRPNNTNRNVNVEQALLNREFLRSLTDSFEKEQHYNNYDDQWYLRDRREFIM